MNINEILKLKGRAYVDGMIQWIKDNFKDTLGDDVKLLEQPGGLEKIHQKYFIKNVQKLDF